jgi:hypothetical protein
MRIVYCGPSDGPMYFGFGFNLDDGEGFVATNGIRSRLIQKKTPFRHLNSQLLSPKTEFFEL